MTSDDVKKHIWRNTLSNYWGMFCKLVLGLILFRLLYQSLPKEEFGFWALLWSVFGYGILLDFGFGFTAVKRVAELSVKKEWAQLSRVLSTIFWLYVIIAVGIILVALFGSHEIMRLFKVSPQNYEEFRQILVYFFIGMAIAFPLGIFPEILIGQQRILLTNNIFLVGLLANFVLIGAALHYGWGLTAIFMIALACCILPNFICGVYALKSLSAVSLSPRFFSVGMIRETMSISIYAYVTTLSNMILGKTDQLVISTCLTVAAVALYQAGAKIGEMFGHLVIQLPDTFSPAAAHLHAKGDHKVLRRLLVDGTRFSVMIATPVYLIAALYMEGLLRILTGEIHLATETFWVAQVLLLWQYVTVVTQSVPKRIFMMCGHEKRLMKLGVAEALLNLVLSVALVLYYKNVVCVAIGSLVATSVLGFFYVWPWAARESEMTNWEMARRILLPSWTACLPVIAFALLGRFLPWLDFRQSMLFLVVQGILATAVAIVCVWRWALSPSEKEKISSKFGTMFGSKKPA